jgi:amidase
MKILPRFLATVATVALLAAAPASARSVPLDALTIADINAAFDAGTLTSEKLVELTLARIAAYDEKGPVLNADARHSGRAQRQFRYRRDADHGRLDPP